MCIWEIFLLSQQVSEDKDFTQRFEEVFNQDETENLYLCKESEEVAVTVAGYIAKKKKMIKRLQCNLCKSILTGQCTTTPYFHLLSPVI